MLGYKLGSLASFGLQLHQLRRHSLLNQITTSNHGIWSEPSKYKCTTPKSNYQKIEKKKPIIVHLDSYITFPKPCPKKESNTNPERPALLLIMGYHKWNIQYKWGKNSSSIKQPLAFAKNGKKKLEEERWRIVHFHFL